MEATTGFHEFKDKVKRNYSPNDKEYPTWMQSVRATLGVLKDRPWDLSIYKVPNQLRRLKEDAYNPRIVSIGPFHQHKHELRVMEEHKWRYMLNFLCRGSKAGTNLDECGKTISDLEGKARGHYAENINLNKHELVEIFLVDGCFILELLIRHAEKDKKDPIINNAWMVPTLQHDLALLENQIPFCVLQNLFITIQKSAPEQLPLSLTEYVLHFFRTALNLSEQTVDMVSASLETDGDKCKHLLDILHHVYLHNIPEISPKSQDITWGLRCATQLFRSGIQFQVGGSDRMLDVEFSNGVITIPLLGINLESSDFIFRNLIAFEQCSFGGKHHITSYAKLMKCLIRSSQDAELLQQKGIITNKEDGGIIEDVSTFFDSLCRGVVFKDFYFTGLCGDVNKYHKSRFQWSRVKARVKVWCNGNMVTLKKDYFTNPWSIISFIAAVLLLSFTALQTFYTVHSYYK